MSDLPKRVPGATMTWPLFDPDATVLGRYFGDNQRGGDEAALGLLHRVLDGLHRFTTEQSATPREEVVAMTDEPVADVDAEMAAHAAAVLFVLQRARQQREWTLDDLAARIGNITAQTLEALEKGTIKPRLTDLFQISAALDLHPASVVTKALGG